MVKFLFFLGVVVTLANAAVATVYFDGLNEIGRQKVEKVLEIFDF